MSEWRKQRDGGAVAGLAGKDRPAKRTADQVELDRLSRSNARLETELKRTKTALEITGKCTLRRPTARCPLTRTSRATITRTYWRAKVPLRDTTEMIRGKTVDS